MRIQFKDSTGKVIGTYTDSGLVLALSNVTILMQSQQGYEGLSVIDRWLRTWTIVDGMKVFVDGVSYHWGVANSYLMWDDTVYCWNDALQGYVTEKTDEHGNHLGWNDPVDDPRDEDGNGGNVPPPTDDGTLMVGGSIHGNIITVNSNPGFAEGDRVIIPATQPRGQYGPGGTYPERLFETESDMHESMPSIEQGEIVGCLDTGMTYYMRDGRLVGLLADEGHWYVGHIVPKAYFGQIVRIDGNRFEMDKEAIIDVSGVEIIYDASLDVLDCIDAGGEANLNKLFPGWSRAAVNGQLVPNHANGVHLTCDSKGSFELFSPAGCPTISVEWLSPQDCLSDYVTLRGNVGDQGYGLGWEDTTTKRYGQHGPLTQNWMNSWLACFPPAHVFRQGQNCVHQDAKVIDAFVLATGGHGCGDSHSYRILMQQTQPLREYIQWHAQYASTTSRCSIEDCEVDSVALLPAFEGMHGHCDILRPRGRNYTMAMNNASGIIENPRIHLDPGCTQAHVGYPIWMQSFNYAPVINLNKNSSPDNPWGAQGGITLIHPEVYQPEELDDIQGNMACVNVQELPLFRLEGGLDAVFPAERLRGNGAVGIQSYAHGGYFDGKINVEGECVNERNAYKVFAINGPVAGPALELPPGESVFG